MGLECKQNTSLHQQQAKWPGITKGDFQGWGVEFLMAYAIFSNFFSRANDPTRELHVQGCVDTTHYRTYVRTYISTKYAHISLISQDTRTSIHKYRHNLSKLLVNT